MKLIPLIDLFNFKNKAIYIEPRFNNPTGRSLTISKRKEVSITCGAKA